MFCAHCGSPMNNDAKFCPACGTKVVPREEPMSPIEEEPSASTEDADDASASPIVEEASIVPSDFSYSKTSGSATAGGSTSSAASGTSTATGASQASSSKPWVDPNRSTAITVLLSIVTCGIFNYYFCYTLARDLNVMCEGDGEETPGLLAFIMLSFVTCGVYSYYWYYKIGNRLQTNAPRYGLSFQESGTTILLWQLVGVLLCCIGPIIALNIVIGNTNAMARAYNNQK